MPLPKRKLPSIHAEQLLDFCQQLDQLKKDNPGRPLILYTAFSFSHNYLKLLHQMVKHGALIALHLADGHMCGTVSLAEMADGTYFHALLVSNPYIKELPWLAENYAFDAIHASVGTSSPYVFRELVTRSRSPVIIDYFDFREIMFDKQGLTQNNFGVENLALELKMWGEIFTGAAGIIHLDSPEIVERLSRRHGHTPLALFFQSYVSEEWVAQWNIPDKTVHGEMPRSIVFAGGLHKPSQHGYAFHGSFPDGVLGLVEQGFEFTIFNGCDSTGEGYATYQDKSRSIPGFHYRSAVPNFALARELAAFDLGWNAQNLATGNEDEYYFRTLMGSKLFNYLEAGLPCVVSNYATFAADFVREYNIGIALDWDQWADFGRIAATTDWESIRASVATARKTLTMEQNMGRFIHFYNTACGREIFPQNKVGE
jgi:hypothetical protein